MPSSSSCCSVISPVQIIFPEPKRNPRPGELSHPQEGSRRSGKHSEQERHPFPPNSLYSTVEEISKVVQHTRHHENVLPKPRSRRLRPPPIPRGRAGFSCAVRCHSSIALLVVAAIPPNHRNLHYQNKARPLLVLVAFPCPRPPAGLPNCHGSCRRQHSLRTRRG